MHGNLKVQNKKCRKILHTQEIITMEETIKTKSVNRNPKEGKRASKQMSDSNR